MFGGILLYDAVANMQFIVHADEGSGGLLLPPLFASVQRPATAARFATPTPNDVALCFRFALALVAALAIHDQFDGAVLGARTHALAYQTAPAACCSLDRTEPSPPPPHSDGDDEVYRPKWGPMRMGVSVCVCVCVTLHTNWAGG